MLLSRRSALQGAVAVVLAPTIASASIQDDKRAFIAQCDESISITRLAGAPHKFVGKKVDLHGMVGPAMQQTDAFNLNDIDNPAIFVIVLGNAKDLEQGQSVRVLGTVESPETGVNTAGGNGTYAVVRARFVA
jgi:hypothetical protein